MKAYVPLLLSMAVVDFLAAVTPGPNFLIVTQLAVGRDRRRGLAATLGIMTANLVWCLAVALGLVALFALVPWVYAVLKVIGGIYLVSLGLRLWVKRNDPRATSEPSFAGESAGAYTKGFLTALSNPKSVVYFGSIFTLFMQPGAPAWVQTAAVAIVCFNSLLWYGSVAILFSSGPARRLQAAIRRPIDRVAGTIMIAFGIRLALARD